MKKDNSVIKIWNWYNSLPFDSEYKEVKKKGLFAKRDKPLTLYQYFFRDKLSLWVNLLIPIILILIVILKFIIQGDK